MIIRAAMAVLLSVPALGTDQSLGDIARKTEETRTAAVTPAVKVDARDIDSRVEDAELLDFRFDDARWQRFVAADVWTTQAIDRNPLLYERITSARVQSIRGFERVLAREPEFKAALRSAACDAHEFAYANGALLLGMMVMQNDLPADQMDQVPAAVRANIAFLRGHAAEVRAMTARALQLKARMEKGAKR